jgi:hypothetical protein
MNKIQSLRAALVAALPALSRDPDNLMMTVETGTVICRGTLNEDGRLAFLYRYTVTLLLVDFADDPDVVFLALFRWMMANQREQLQAWANGQGGLPFQADRLDAAKVDLEIKVDLDERVVCTPAGDGFAIDHPAEPPLDPGFGPWADVLSPIAPFGVGLANGETVQGGDG